ncbi:MAG: acetyltransferase [Veillonellaceae bacterium]|nr:acetyltransferase [Veillonellaceae bacterium]
MKKLLIAGAGGWGRVVRQWALDIQSQAPRWESILFLDDNPAVLEGFGLNDSLVGTIRDYIPSGDEEFICGIGDPNVKMNICEQLRKKGAHFINLFHPQALITNYGEFGAGIIVSPFAAIVVTTKIGDFVTVNAFSVIGHDSTVENGCTLSAHCDIMANVHLEEGVFLGSGARILPNLHVGRNAKVGAGSVVVRNVPAGATVFGNPAQMIS